MTVRLQFAWVALCFTAALLSRLRCVEYRDWAFLTLGMGFTLTADYFLILRDRQIIGTFVFCFAHAAYILRTGSVDKKWLLFAPAALMAGMSGANLLLSVVFTYAALFAVDITAHILMYKNNTRLPKVNRVLALTGIVLFALCDINVLLYNLPGFIPGDYGTLRRAAYTALWAFYIPAQGLIAVSGLKFRPRKGL